MNALRWIVLRAWLLVLLLSCASVRPAPADEAAPAADKPASAGEGKLLTAEQREKLGEARQLDQQMFRLQQQGNPRAAIGAARQALAIRQEVLGEQHADTAQAVHSLGVLLMTMGDYRGAQTQLEQALAVQKELLGEKDPTTIATIGDLGGSLKMQGNYAAARPYYQRSLELYKQVNGEHDSATAIALNNLALLLQAEGQYDQALPYLEQALAIDREVLDPKDPSLATALNNMGSLLDDMGDYLAARPYFEQGLAINRQSLGPRHPATANSLNNVAFVLQEMGDLAAALRFYEQALDIDLKAFGRDHPATAYAANNMGFVLDAMGDYQTAARYYQEALEIRRKVLGDKHPLTALSLNNLGLLYRVSGEYEKARKYLEQALAIHQEVLGENHPLTALSLHNMGFLLHLEGDYAGARPYYEQALAIREKVFGEKNADTALSVHNIGRLLQLSGDFAAAQPYLERALTIRQQVQGENHPSTAQSHEALGVLFADMQKWSDAAAQTDAARRIFRRHIARVLPALSEQKQLVFLRQVDVPSLFGSLTLGLHGRDNPQLCSLSAAWLINGKAVGHEALAQRALLARDVKSGLSPYEVGQLAAARRKLAKLSMTAPRAGQEQARLEQLDRLQREENFLERQLATASGQAAPGEPWAELEKIRQALRPEEVLVEIAQFRDYEFSVRGQAERWRPACYAAWIIPAAGKGDVRIVDLGDAATVDEAVAAARRTFLKPRAKSRGLVAEDEQTPTQAQQDFRDAPAKLAALVLHPILEQIGDADRLVISPDASLWLVPFGALPLPDGRYAIEKYPISYLISSRGLAAGQQTRSPKSKPIVMADPDFDLTPDGTVAATAAVFRKPVPKPSADQLALREVSNEAATIHHVERLPGTAKEASAIAPQLAKYVGEAPTLYLERYALEGVFKALDRPRAVVLSTHGFFLTDQQAVPDDTVNEDDTVYTRGAMLAADGKLTENPLLRCGLLLAGCNRRGAAAASAVDSASEADDGILTGMEIISTDLRGTELVVLSACETGLGEVHNGEGVAGLRQAFQLAGARAVVASLWQVPDEQTAELMGLLFTNLAAGLPKDEALRKAQLSMIETHKDAVGSEPFYWAAFTLTGR